MSSILVEKNHSSREEQGELVCWVRNAFEEGFSSISNKRQDQSLFVKERRLDLVKIPYWMFDSTAVEDIHLIAGAESYVIGLGAAKEWAFSPESSLGDVEAALKLEHIPRKLSRNIWLVGGCSFPLGTRVRGARRNRTWAGFPHSRWVIPALTLSNIGDGREGSLVLTISFDGRASLLSKKKLGDYYGSLAKTLITPKNEGSTLPRVIRLRNQPSRSRWISLVRRGLKSLNQRDLKKVVLARSMGILFNHNVSPSIVLKNLSESNPQSTIFAIRRADTFFMGATPERLVSMKHGELKVDCLAASTPRAPDNATDELLGRGLLEDRKSRYEHQLVVERVTKSLSEICSKTRAQEIPSVKKLPTVQHLHTIVRGHLRRDMSIWSAARTLWPTPATGGEPKEAAVRWIQEFEGIDRGWYSGVVGCVNASGNDGNFLVAIRSGVIRRNRAVLFAGAGIVPQSDPEKEFEETSWKMETMMKALATTAAVSK